MTTSQILMSNPRGIFQCTSCHEYINDSMTNCQFCNALVDLTTVESAVKNVNETNKACNDGNYISILARSAVVFYLLSWIPILGAFAGWGFLFVMLAIPILVIRWWVKYLEILTSDKDYQAAKKLILISLAIWAVMAVIWLIGSIIYTLLVASMIG